MLSFQGDFFIFLALNPHSHFSFKGNDNLNLITQTAVRHCQNSKIMNARFIYLIEYDVAQYRLVQERSRNLLIEILLMKITREQTVGTMINMQVHNIIIINIVYLNTIIIIRTLVDLITCWVNLYVEMIFLIALTTTVSRLISVF